MFENNMTNDFLVPWLGETVPWCVPNGAAHASYWDYTKFKREQGRIEWQENKPFKAALKVNRYTGSTSSTQIVLVNTANDKIFHMRIEDFIEALSRSACVFGILIGEWKFRKTGNKYYGLVFIG